MMGQVLPSHVQFLKDLEALLADFDYEGEGSASETGISSHKVIHLNLQDRGSEVYDFETGLVDTTWDDPRSSGHLAAYVKTFGPRFSWRKLRFQEGYMHIDLANAKSYLRYSLLEFRPSGCFSLTEKGRALIAPFVKVSNADMDDANA